MKRRKRLKKDTSEAGSLVPFVMTENGYMPASKAPAGGSGGAVHAPQIMNLSSLATPPRRGTRELLRLYSESPWLRAIVNKIGRAVAETDWVLFAKRGANGRYVTPDGLLSKAGNLRRKEFNRQLDVGGLNEILDHPILDLLDAGTGNPRLNGFAALQITQIHMDLCGEAFWLLEPGEFGVPVAFWPLPPSWVTKFPTDNDPFYEMAIPGGQSVKVPVTLIVPFIDPDPEDPYRRGTGIAKALDDEIQIDEFAAKHQKAFFLNRARPDIIISGQFISPKDAERLEKQWLSDHQGFWKSFKPLFFSQKIDVKELSQSFESMQMVQVRKQERDTFISVFGAPPEKFGVIGESKRSTIAAADYFWNKDLIRPRVELIRRVLQQVLIPRYDARILLYYDTPVIQDDEFQLDAMRQAPWAATINEWRKAQGQTSLGPAGDVLVVPMNNYIIPTKTENGTPLTTPEVVQEASKQLAQRGPVQSIEIETKSISDDIAKAVVGALGSEIKRLVQVKE